MIVEAAYYHSERRGFDPGHEVDDWLVPRARLMRPSRWAKRRHLLALEPHTNQDMTDVAHVLTTDLLRPDQRRAR